MPKKTWRKKIIYRKTNTRRLTTGELAELEKAEEIKRGKARATTPEDIEDEDKQGFLILDSPPSARASESQGGTTITVGLSPMRQPPLVLLGSSSPPPYSPSSPSLPPSTAPPRLE